MRVALKTWEWPGDEARWVSLRTVCSLGAHARSYCNYNRTYCGVHVTECFMACEDDDKFAQYYSAVSIALKLSSPA